MESLLYKEQTNLRDSISKFLINIKKEPLARRNKTILTAKIAELEDLWAKFNENDDELRKDPDLTNSYFVKEEYKIAEEIYNAAITVINEFMESIPENSKSNDELKKGENGIDKNQNNDNEVKKIEKLFYFRLREFEKFINLIENSMAEHQSKMYYENAIRKLYKLEDELRVMLEDLLLLSTDILEKQLVNMLDESRQKSNHIISIMQKALEIETHKESMVINHKPPKLQPISIPKFNGRFKEWTGFKNLFLNVIHGNKTLSQVEKLHYLRTYLEGEPLKMINHLQITNENYEVAFQLITNRYENSRKLIDTYLDIIFDHPITSSKSPSSLKHFHDNIRECLEGLKALDISIESPMLIYLGLKKLDTESIKAFEEGLNNPKELPTIEQFMRFLESRYLVIESINDRKSNNNSGKSSINSNLVAKKLCYYCQSENHRMYSCEKFNKLSTKDRNIVVTKKSLCKNCLNHKLNTKCYSKRSCLHCGRKHHTILHYNSQQNQSQTNAKLPISTENKNSSESAEIERTTMAVNSTFQCQVLLSTALIYIKSRYGRYEPFRALIDQGSQVSLITEEAAQLLGLPREASGMQVTCLGANNPKFSKHRMHIEIQSHFARKQKSLQVTTHILPTLTGNLPNTDIPDNFQRWSNITLADPDYNISGPIDVLLGADVYGTILLNGVKRGHPTAIQTTLGWILSGPIINTSSNNAIVQTNTSIIDIQDEMTRFWNIEEIVPKGSSNEEEIFRRTKIQRQINGKYLMQLPFKNEIPDLGNSRNQALARFMQLEKSLTAHPKKKIEYNNFIKEYLNLGHMKPAINTNPNQGYYLPHHAVWKKDNITTKLRVVFDASAKTTNGKSLNDEILVGPTIQETLTSILTRWRSYKYVFTADIEKMYRQIDIADKDQKFQKILWRFSNLEPVQEFYLTTVTYGTASAPYLATRALQQLADDESSKNSLINKIIKKDFYIDDLMSGADSKQEAITIINSLIETLSKGGFTLRKWTSNNCSLIDHLPENLKLRSLLEIDSDDSIKTLGIWWNSLTDEFSYKIKIDNIEQKTKRSFLSNISKIFDPMGWVAPVTINAKILMQELWTLKLNWDEKLPQTFQMKWEKLIQQLKALEEIKIPRYLHTSKNTYAEIHGFSDASEKAYAALVYARIKTADGYKITLLGAKTRVAPLNKEQSIPRLELCGALLLVNYVKQIKNSFEFDNSTPTYYWTDSKITLAWIKGQANRWKSFVSHRVTEINKLTTHDQWLYVSTNDNPADLASRGIKTAQLVLSDLWWHGPVWLKSEKTFIHENQFTTLEEVRKNAEALKVNTLHLPTDISIIISRFSSFTKLISVISYVRRFKTKHKGTIGAREFNETTEFIIKAIQQIHFSNDIRKILKGDTKTLSSKLQQLCPFIDNNGLMRVGGRLENLYKKSIPKNPIILPAVDEFTKLLVNHAHMQTLHGGNQLTHAYIRQKYWIPNGKCLVKKVIHNCIKCIRFRGQTSKQIMGNLPSVRINPAPPFTNTGLDYAGPINIRVSKGRGTKSYKGFIVVFVCLATKAIHLEVVSDLTSKAFLAAFDRFTSRRGYCLNIYSDNGTTFIGADKMLQKELKGFIKESSELIAEAYNNKTNWHFIPPGAPHFGGIWEAAVKSMKHHLKRVIGDQTLTFEELTTILYRIEACLNSRPLLPLSNDPSDFEALTPGHFLIGRPLNANPECDMKNINYNTRWQLITKLVQHFWNRWATEYLTGLQQRRKWFTKEQNMNPGDLVLIKEDNLPPTKWIMGRIVEVHPGTDGLVRAVTLKLPENKFLKRPITKLCPLLNADQDKTLTSQNLQELHNANIIREVNNFGNQSNPNFDEFSSVFLTTSSGKITETKDLEIRPPPRDWMRGKNIDQIKTQAQEFKKKSSTQVPVKRKGPRIRPYIPAKQLILATLIMTCIFPTFSKAFNFNDDSDQNFYVQEFSHQPGIYFEEVGKMRFLRNEWNLIIHYNLNIYDQTLKQLRELLSHLDETCHHADAMCSSTVIQCQLLMHNINTSDIVLKNSNKDYHLNQRLFKRGLINGIGYIANELFGVLDARSAEKYELQIAELQNNQKHVIDLAKNHTSITDATLKIFKESTQHVQEELRFIKDYIQKDKANNFYFSIVLRITLTMMRIQDLQNKLMDIILDTHHGRLNPTLLPPEDLANELKLIRSHISPDVIIPDVIEGNLADLYRLMTIKTRVTNSNIIFSLKIPLPDVELFEIFKLISLPITYKNNSILITPSSEYLIINIHRDHYYPLNKNELDSCWLTADIIHICKPHNPLYNVQSNISRCEVDLINHKNEYFISCSMQTYTKTSNWIQLTKPNAWIYSTYDEFPTDIICNSRVINSTIIKGQGIIYLKPGCLLKQNGLSISAHNTIKSTIKSNFFPLVDSQKLFKDKKTEDFKGFRISATDVQNKLNVLQEIVNEQQKFDEIQNNPNQHDIHHYFSIYLMGILGSIVAIYLFLTQKRSIAKMIATMKATSMQQLSAIPALTNTANDETTV